MGRAGTTRRDGWQSWELQTLYDFVNEDVWLDEAVALLPARTRNAIQVRMSQLRAEAGIVPRHKGPTANGGCISERNRTAAASEKLRRALEELAA